MEYLVMGLLALAVLGMGVLLAARDKARKEALEQAEELRRQLESLQQEEPRRESGRLRQGLHTIHLYAALAEEEARSASLREKQEEIRTLCESLLRDLED